MVTEITKMESFCTKNGKCYVGMTYNEASKKGESVLKEFVKTDTNCDNILSAGEVAERRGNSVKFKNGMSNFFLGYGLLGCLVGLGYQSFSGEFAKCVENVTGMPMSSFKGKILRETILVVAVGAWLKHKVNKFHSETVKMEDKYYEMIEKQKNNANEEIKISEKPAEMLKENTQNDTTANVEADEQTPKEKVSLNA